MTQMRDHGGGLDAAVAEFGGSRDGWMDLSTGINPHPYPVADISAADWAELPDKAAFGALEDAARKFWRIPEDAAILATPGASAPIAQIPHILPAGRATIVQATYNEHAAAFNAAGWQVAESDSDARVVVHPNNPDGALFDGQSNGGIRLLVIDESFCDVMPAHSHIALASRKNTLILKSFGKFWGLAGMRLGMVIGDPLLIGALRDRIGPWQVSGPALRIGTAALRDQNWANETRVRLAADGDRLDQLMQKNGAKIVGGTSLFRLYQVPDAVGFQTQLAKHHIWSRVFPYDKTWLRLGLPDGANNWARLENALLQ